MLTIKSITDTATLSTGNPIPRFGFGSPKADKTVAAVQEAIKVGYRHFDTAQLYGNEREVAEGIVTSGVPRSSIYLTTKWNPPGHPAGGVPPPNPLQEPGVPTDQVYAELQRSKEIFVPQMGHVDLLLVHASRPGPQGRANHWAALVKAKEDGWVKDIGVSNFNEKHLAALPAPTPSVNQIELHPWCQQRPVVDYCQGHGIQIMAFCPLVRAAPHRFSDPVAVRVAEKYGKNVPQVILRWSLQKGFIPIPMSTSAERIESNAQVFDFELDQGDMDDLDALDCGAAGACSMNLIHGP